MGNSLVLTWLISTPFFLDGIRFEAHANGHNIFGLQHATLYATTTTMAFVTYTLNFWHNKSQHFCCSVTRKRVGQRCCARLHGTTTMLWKRLRTRRITLKIFMTFKALHCNPVFSVFKSRTTLLKYPFSSLRFIHALVLPWCCLFFSSEITSPMVKMARHSHALCRFIVHTTCSRKRKNSARQKAYKE